MKYFGVVAGLAAVCSVVCAHDHHAGEETHDPHEHVGETAEDLEAKWGIDVSQATNE